MACRFHVSLFEQLKIVSVVSDHKNGQSSFKMVSWRDHRPSTTWKLWDQTVRQKVRSNKNAGDE